MSIPTQNAINTAIQTWIDNSIAIDAIGENTEALNQIMYSIPTLQQTTFAAIDDVSETAASGTITSSANYANTETVVVGGRTYTFQSSLTNTNGHVKIGASEAASLANLHHAINGTGGTAGTDYAAATTAHPDVTATDNGTHAVTVTAKIAGAAGNAIATTTTSATATWGAATLTGGAGDDVVAVLAAVDDWRDSNRAGELAKDDAAANQLDAAIAVLKTGLEATFA